MGTETAAIARVCEHLEHDDRRAASAALREDYPFVASLKVGRRYTPRQMTAIFIRDGFIDRYSGDRLVFPAVLRVISSELPDVFPFHRNWKMSETHPAYWDLLPTIDHVVPVARGGVDDATNWVTTSMARNGAKGPSTLEQIGWELHPPGDIAKWDGLGSWLLGYVDSSPERGADPYVRSWLKALRLEYPAQ